MAAGRLSTRGVGSVTSLLASPAVVTGRAAALTFSTPEGDVRVKTTRDGSVVVVVLCAGVVLLKPPLLEGGRVLTRPLLPGPDGVVPLLGSVEVVRCFTLGSVEVRA